MRGNTDQKDSEYEHFLHSVGLVSYCNSLVSSSNSFTLRSKGLLSLGKFFNLFSATVIFLGPVLRIANKLSQEQINILRLHENGGWAKKSSLLLWCHIQGLNLYPKLSTILQKIALCRSSVCLEMKVSSPTFDTN